MWVENGNYLFSMSFKLGAKSSIHVSQLLAVVECPKHMGVDDNSFGPEEDAIVPQQWPKIRIEKDIEVEFLKCFVGWGLCPQRNANAQENKTL